jgi:serine/threonine protein kinase
LIAPHKPVTIRCRMSMGTTNPNPNAGATRQQIPLRPGRVIPFGKYLLLERIAVGGMAEVYMSKSFGIEGFEKIIAIKRILPTMAEDEDFIEMFVDEAKIAGQLTHANIAPIYELGKIGDSHYIAMEYVWGKDLLQIMNRFRRMRKRMPPVMVAWIASRMCEALDYAHHKRDRQGHHLNIIHRDVSPQNVLVSYEGEVKLIDFGIAKAASRQTKTQAGVLKGKFGYMSPEQVRGLPIDARSDLFAVGTCMYETLTSERLFMGESDFSTLEKVRNADVTPIHEVVREVPPALGDIVMKALKREPAERWQSAAELQDALQRFLGTQRPPFGTSKLASWLKTAFATEMMREKERMDSFANIGRPAVPPAPRRKPKPTQLAGELDPAKAEGYVELDPDLDEIATSAPLARGANDIHAEATQLSASPFDEQPQVDAQPLAADQSIISDEPTQIFFSADDIEEIVEEPPRPAAAVPTFRPERTLPVGGAVSMPVPGPMHPGPMHAGSVSVRPVVATSSPVQIVPTVVTPQPSIAPPGVPPPATAQLGVPPVPGYVTQPMPPAFATPPGRPVTATDPRVTQTMPPQRRSAARMLLLFAVGSVVMLGLGAGLAYLLVREPVGTVEIRTTPAVGATVSIDGVPRGRAPLRVQRIPSGERVIEVRADGYEAELRRVEVASDSVALLEIALQPLAGAPATSPSQQAPPTTRTETPPESAMTEEPALSAEEQAAADAAARAAEAERLAREREEAARIERERIETERREREDTARAERERIEAERREREEARAAQREEERRLAEERRRQRAEATMQTTTTESSMQTTQATQMTTVMNEVTPVRGGTATIRINSIPWSDVFLDGVAVGRTPIMSLRVSPGTHRVMLRTADGRTRTRSVSVQPGETQTIREQFD